MLVLLLACSGDPKPADTADTSADSADTGETADSADTGDSTDTGDTGDTGDSTDTGEPPDTGDSGDSQGTEGDRDGDGWLDEEDCGPDDASVFPGAEEWCNGVDDDCDGTIDGPWSADAGIWYTDNDGDGYGDPSTAVADCSAPAGTIGDGQDCDDADPVVNPDAVEHCDGVDENCLDGTYDEYLSATWVRADGTESDVTASVLGGTSAAPVIVGDDAAADLYVDEGTLYLCEGFWYMKLVFASPTTEVTVVGRSGADRTSLTTGGVWGGSSGSIVAVTDATVTIEGLDLYGGIGSDGEKGGAVIVGETSGATPAAPNLTIRDSYIEGNETQYGGGLAVLGHAWVHLEDTWVAWNDAAVAGGGAWVQDRGTVSCEATVLAAAGIFGNTAPIAGGLYLSGNNHGVVETVGCDWGSADAGDDNDVSDIQQNPYTTHEWCFPNASALTDTVSCASGSCTGPTDGACP